MKLYLQDHFAGLLEESGRSVALFLMAPLRIGAAMGKAEGGELLGPLGPVEQQFPVSWLPVVLLLVSAGLAGGAALLLRKGRQPSGGETTETDSMGAGRERFERLRDVDDSKAFYGGLLRALRGQLSERTGRDLRPLTLREMIGLSLFELRDADAERELTRRAERSLYAGRTVREEDRIRDLERVVKALF